MHFEHQGLSRIYEWYVFIETVYYLNPCAAVYFYICFCIELIVKTNWGSYV